MNNKNKVITILVVVVLSVGLLFYLGSYIVPKALVTLSSRATNQKISMKNSILIGGNLMATANGIDESVVNVFVLDNDSKGIQGKMVELSGLETLEAVTDATGKATFKLKSTTPGRYLISASVGGVVLNNTVTVVFR